jgi:PleD family two-component response regulator
MSVLEDVMRQGLEMHEANRIYIVAATQELAEELKQSIGLRGFDQVTAYTFVQAPNALRLREPDLVILDLGKQNQFATAALSLLNALPEAAAAIVMAERFDEDVFFNLYDAGARDFLVKPVASPYLVSRILLALDALQERQQVQQWEGLLTGLSVLTPFTRVYNAPFFEKLLQLELDKFQQADMPAPLSLLALELGFQLPSTLEMPGPLGGANLEIVLGKVFRQTVRVKDYVGQQAENTFVVLLPQTTKAGAERVLERMLSELAKQLAPYFTSEAKASLPLRVGVLSFDNDTSLKSVATATVLQQVLALLQPHESPLPSSV